jgi:hypothetical protein
VIHSHQQDTKALAKANRCPGCAGPTYCTAASARVCAACTPVVAPPAERPLGRGCKIGSPSTILRTHEQQVCLQHTQVPASSSWLILQMLPPSLSPRACSRTLSKDTAAPPEEVACTRTKGAQRIHASPLPVLRQEPRNVICVHGCGRCLRVLVAPTTFAN